jgi:hypothetical protein
MKLDALPVQAWIGIVVALVVFVSVLFRSHRNPSENSYVPQHRFVQHHFVSRSQGGLGGILLTMMLFAGLAGGWLYLKEPNVLQQMKPSSLSLPSLSVAQAAAVAPPGQLQSGPSLTASFIDKVLQANNSPAQRQGLGTTLYQLSQQYNIDDAVPLAQFDHESGFGKFGVARVTRSIGNIKCSPGYSCYAGFRAYASWADSAKDWFQLMKKVYLPQGWDTVQKMIPHYAPDGGEKVYINSVLADIKRWRAGEV